MEKNNSVITLAKEEVSSLKENVTIPENETYNRELKNTIENLNYEEATIAARAIANKYPAVLLNVLGETFEELMTFKTEMAATCLKLYEHRLK